MFIWDLICDVAGATDELLFGYEGQVGGILGTPINAALDAVIENPGKSLAIVAATIATGGLGLAAAPMIAGAIGSTGVLGAASTGVAINTLSGAALSNASLAAIGGGAVAAGGGGIAAGTTVVACSTAAAGGAAATVTAVATS